MADPTPIIFIHYGPAAFLRPVFYAARRSNPHAPIHFLGDATNRHLVPQSVNYHAISDYTCGPMLEAFSQRFVPIAGSRHHYNKSGGVDTWLRFVFERWFVILEFLDARKIGAFWIFDSDTLIAGALSPRELSLQGLDATEQCVGCCLNGYVSSREVVRAYCQKMIDLYRTPSYLEAQRERLKIHTGLAFNEMDAWQTHRDEKRLLTRPLGSPCESEAFDDALAITSGWQTAAAKIRGRIPVKRLARDNRGGFFAFEEKEGTPVRLVTLNLSWLPDYVYQLLAPGCLPVERLPYNAAFCREVDFSEPLFEQLRRRTLEATWRVRSRFSKKS